MSDRYRDFGGGLYVVIRLVTRHEDQRMVWWLWFNRGVLIRRSLLDSITGEILDDVWRDKQGRIRSWTKGPSSSDGRPFRRAMWRESIRRGKSGDYRQDGRARMDQAA